MPIFHRNNKLIVFLDNSRAEIIATCQTLGYVKVIEQLKRPHDFAKIPMKVGTAFHRGLEEYIKTRDMYPALSALTESLTENVQPQLDRLDEICKSPIKIAEHQITTTQKNYPRRYNTDRMRRLFHQWMRANPLESFQLNLDKTTTEVRFCVPVYVNDKNSYMDIWLCGQFDILGINLENQLVGKDLKTMGWLKPGAKNEYHSSTQLIGYTYAMKQLLKTQYYAETVGDFEVFALEIPDTRSDQRCKTHKIPGTQCDLQHAKTERISNIKFSDDIIEGWKKTFRDVACTYNYLNDMHNYTDNDTDLKSMLETDGMFRKGGFDRICTSCNLNSFCYKDNRDFANLRALSVKESWFPYEMDELEAIIKENYE